MQSNRECKTIRGNRPVLLSAKRLGLRQSLALLDRALGLVYTRHPLVHPQNPFCRDWEQSFRNFLRGRLRESVKASGERIFCFSRGSSRNSAPLVLARPDAGMEPNLVAGPKPFPGTAIGRSRVISQSCYK